MEREKDVHSRCHAFLKRRKKMEIKGRKVKKKGKKAGRKEERALRS